MRKESLSTMIVKTLLAITIFTGMGVIVIGGAYIIGSYYKIGIDKKIIKPVNQETENYYDLLESKCDDGCCLSSLKTMRENNYKEADKSGECSEGFYMDMMKCITSYQWCVPMKETEWKNCEQNSDCVETQADCCSCSSGGKQIGINKKYLKSWEDFLKDKCQDIDCIALFNCKEGKVVCENNKCEFQKKADNDQFDISNWQSYRNEEYGFEFEYPEKWIANKHEIISNKIYFASSDIVNKESGDTPNSMEIMIYQNINELDYKNIGLINLNDYLDKYSNISDPPIRNVESFSVKNLSGYYADVRDFGGGKNYYIQTSNYTYVIRFSISEKIINQILSTFKFIEE